MNINISWEGKCTSAKLYNTDYKQVYEWWFHLANQGCWTSHAVKTTVFEDLVFPPCFIFLTWLSSFRKCLYQYRHSAQTYPGSVQLSVNWLSVCASKSFSYRLIMQGNLEYRDQFQLVKKVCEREGGTDRQKSFHHRAT